VRTPLAADADFAARRRYCETLDVRYVPVDRTIVR
jgi:hypothetical protein